MILPGAGDEPDARTFEATFQAVVGRIVPADRDPGAVELGAASHAAAILAGQPAERAAVAAGLARLDGRARASHGVPFADLPPEMADALLRAEEGAPWFARLVETVSLGVYADPANGANVGGASWRFVGYRPGVPAADAPRTPTPAPPPPSDVTDCDVVVVGAGASGIIVAAELAEAGRSVVLLERGEWLVDAARQPRDHLRNHRLSRYGNNTGPGPEGHPRVFVAPSGEARTVAPHEFEYHNNAVAVGAGTLVYGGLAWRLHPDDFRMASLYGVPAGSSLADWPIGAGDLAPFYERAEREIGVAGEASAAAGPCAPPRGYPMPPLAANPGTARLADGAARLGIATFAPPLLVNSVARDGRPACIGCGACVGFPCPVDAKNGTQNTMLPRALATGRFRLVTGAFAERVETDGGGRATGVTFREREPSGGFRRQRVSVKAVVLCAGAIETARLLLLSATGAAPDGLGNRHGLVGRNLQGHLYPTAFGLFDAPVHDSRGPGVTIATTAYVHGNPGIVGGAMLADDFVMPPAIFYATALPPDLRRWGQEAKDFIRHAYRRVLQVKGPVHETPDPTCRVTLDPAVRDEGGLPVARLSGVVHTETMRTAAFVRGRAEDWVRAAGAMRLWSTMPPRRLSGFQHQAGTCRMGSDPARAVTDPFGRVFGHDNLFVSDASLHPTNGGFNPVLTVMALAFRNGRHIAETM